MCTVDRELTFSTRGSPTGDIHHPLMYQPFVARVHALIDLVDDAEGGTG